MTTLLAKLFIKDRENVESAVVRRQYGMMCGFLGIALNAVLFLCKLFIGILSGAISIMADAFNNLSDAGSSIITLLGFKIAGQKPDLEHPFGHGRMEYISGLIVSMIIIVVGFELARSSVEKIISPEQTAFSWISVCVLSFSILIKIYMAVYNSSIGKRISSAAMQATATDSLSDCISTAVVLICTILSKYTSLELDAYCGLVVSVLVMYAGIKAAIGTINPLLGEPPTKEFVKEVSDIVMSGKDVQGIHDLVVHDYGPGRRMISLHAEVPSDGDILRIHDEIDNIEKTLREKLFCEAVIHMDPIDTTDAKVGEMRKVVKKIVADLGDDFTMHDFRMVSGPTHTNLIFDVVVPFNCKLTERELKNLLEDKITKLEGKYYAVITFDRPYGEMA